MMLILANAPQRWLKRTLGNRRIRQWIYLGKNYESLNRWRKVLNLSCEVDYARKLYAVTEAKRRPFIGWVDAVSYAGRPDKEWLFSVPAVKNPFSSTLFLNVCYFFVLTEMIRENRQIDVVIAESPALCRLIKTYFPGHWTETRFNPLLEWVIRLRTVIKSLLRYGKYVLDFMRRFCAVRLVLSSRTRILLRQNRNWVLIRNYIDGNYSDSEHDTHEKHYFPGLSFYLQEQHYAPFFVSTPVNVKSYMDLCRRIACSHKNIVLAEEFLTWDDYVHAFLAPSRAARHNIAHCDFEGYDFHILMDEEYGANWTEFGLLYASLLSRFGRRLKEKGVHLSHIIHWSEFQAFEKGFIAGLREAYPGVTVIGSQPFLMPPNHLSLVPSLQDKIFKLIPEKLLVLGPVQREILSEYVSDTNIDYTPALRYQRIFKHLTINPDGEDLLVLFGYSLANALRTLKILLNIHLSLQNFHRIYLKLHPASYFDRRRIERKTGKPLPSSFQFVDGSLEDYLENTAVGICGATGAAVELAMRGILVVQMAETHDLTMNYLAYREEPDLWRLCFSESEALTALQLLSKLRKEKPERIQQKALEFRRWYFADPDNHYWENYLLNCEQKLTYV